MSSICSLSVSIPFLLLFFGGCVLEVIWSAVSDSSSAYRPEAQRKAISLVSHRVLSVVFRHRDPEAPRLQTRCIGPVPGGWAVRRTRTWLWILYCFWECDRRLQTSFFAFCDVCVFRDEDR